MEFINSFLLGLLQGITEFLPISSSIHIAIAEALLGHKVGSGITFEIVIHFGSLCSILLYYRERLIELVYSWGDLLNADSYKTQYRQDNNLKLTVFVVLSMIPAGIVGILFKEDVEAIFNNLTLVSWMYLITGTILMLTYLRKKLPNHLNYTNVFLVGIAQAVALLPGISRSGSTISAALYLGVKREEAANFSLLMVIPVLAGAMLLEVGEIANSGMTYNDYTSLVIGFITSFISGYFALKYMIIILKSKGIYPFGWYCWALGISGLIFF